MIANQMVGLLGHLVNVLPASIGYKLMYHGSELICILSNGISMFQVPVATHMYARKRLNGLQYIHYSILELKGVHMLKAICVKYFLTCFGKEGRNEV